MQVITYKEVKGKSQTLTLTFFKCQPMSDKGCRRKPLDQKG